MPGSSGRWRNEVPRFVMNSKYKSTVARAAALCVAATLFTAQTSWAHDMAAMSMGEDSHDGSMHSAMAPHMRMTELGPAKPGDESRAREITAAMRTALEKYRDYRVALADGYRIFLPMVPQDEYHFWNAADSAREYGGRVELARPGALLYVKDKQEDYRLVGARFSALPSATPDQLDAIVPLSVAQWHVHTDICLPTGITLNHLLRGDIGQDRAGLPGLLPVCANPSLAAYNRRFGIFADGRFGFTGKIKDAQTCEAAGGEFIAQAWGWMVHVYPFAGDDLKVAFGHKAPAQTASKD